MARAPTSVLWGMVSSSVNLDMMEKCGCKKKKGAFFMVYIVVPICPGERAFGDIGGEWRGWETVQPHATAKVWEDEKRQKWRYRVGG